MILMTLVEFMYSIVCLQVDVWYFYGLLLTLSNGK